MEESYCSPSIAKSHPVPKRERIAGLWSPGPNNECGERTVILSNRHWVPNAEASECKACKTEFWMFRRKHHCRRCCYVFCGDCSRYRIPIFLEVQYQCSLRVCRECFSLLSEKKFGKSITLRAHSSSQFKSEPRNIYIKTLDLDRDQVLYAMRAGGRHPHSEESHQIESAHKSIIGIISQSDQAAFCSPSPQHIFAPHGSGELLHVTTADSITVPADIGELCSTLEISRFHLEYYLDVQSKCLERLGLADGPDVREFLLKILIFLGEKISFYPLVEYANNVGGFIKIKKMLHGELDNSELYRGIAFTNTFTHKHMLHSTPTPKLMLVSFPMDYAAATPGIVSVSRDLNKERAFKNALVRKIRALSPHIILSSCPVSHEIIERLANEGVQIMSNVKHNLIEKISNLTGAPIISCLEQLDTGPGVGYCTYFLMRYPCGTGKSISVLSEDANAAYFSVILKGTDIPRLARIKQAIYYMIQVYCNTVVEHLLSRGLNDDTAASAGQRRPYFDYPKPTEKRFLKAVSHLGGDCLQLLPQRGALCTWKRDFGLDQGYSVLRHWHPSGVPITNTEALHKAMVELHEFLTYRRTERTSESFIVLMRHVDRLTFCGLYETVAIEFCGNNDVTIEGLIAELRRSASDICQSTSCKRKIGEHIRYYVSSNHMISVSLQNADSGSGTTPTEMQIECSKCAFRTPPAALPRCCLVYSFGRLLELYRYCTLFNSRHPSVEGECKFYNKYRYVFMQGGASIVIQHETLKIHTLSLPLLTRSAAEWNVTHTRLRSKCGIIVKIYSYFIILVARAEEIFRLLGATPEKRGKAKAFVAWIIKETERVTSLAKGEMRTIKKAKDLRTNGYFSYLLSARIRNCEAALAAYSSNLLGTHLGWDAEERMLKLDNILHIDTKYNPLSAKSIFKLKISPESVQFTLDTLPYSRWDNAPHANHYSEVQEQDYNNTEDLSESGTRMGDETPDADQGLDLAQTTRVLRTLAVPNKDEPSSIIAFALNSKYYSTALSGITLKSHTQPKALLPQIKYSCSIPALSTRALGDLGQASHLKHELRHVTFEDDVNDLHIRCKVMYASAFESLRQTLREDRYYISSLLRCYAWDHTGGKSDSRFFKTADGRYVLKEVSRLEQYALCEAMPKYLEYIGSAILNDRPTLLAVPLGAYSIHCRGAHGQTWKMDLITMRNIFHNKSITRIYDLKGSMRSRRANHTNECAEVLMDENYLEFLAEAPPTLMHSSDKEFIRAAVWNDAGFLTSLNVMDYSMAIGINRERTHAIIGILDYMRTFTWDKRLENWVKESALLSGKRGEPTIVSPDQYSARFARAIDAYITATPDEYSEPWAGKVWTSVPDAAPDNL